MRLLDSLPARVAFARTIPGATTTLVDLAAAEALIALARAALDVHNGLRDDGTEGAMKRRLTSALAPITRDLA